MTHRYDPSIFDVRSIAEAREIILTPAGQTSEERWEREAPYLMELLARHVTLGERSLVIDYGCGVGRMAKALIIRYGCRVIGVDISVSMRALAQVYVGSDRFIACAPDWLPSFAHLRPDAALAVWVLQHCVRPEEDLILLRAALSTSGARLLVVNNNCRVVPVTGALWADDGKDVEALLRGAFRQVSRGELDVEAVSAELAESTFWGVYESSGPCPAPK
jgi:SAM-dependent methyltransferase